MKVGDRVRVVRDHLSTGLVGYTGTVTAIERGAYPYNVFVSLDTRVDGGLLAGEMEAMFGQSELEAITINNSDLWV